jgi:uncharacterized protein (DUF433 family)
VIDWSGCPEAERVPGKVSGAWVFRNTRVPIEALFENLSSGASVEEFVEWFQGVTRRQVQVVLNFAAHAGPPEAA